MRLLVAAGSEPRANQLLREVESTFHQYANVEGNSLRFKHQYNADLKRLEKAFSFREHHSKAALQLSIDELSTLVHFPEHGGVAAPQFKQSHAKTAAAPTSVPHDGTLLGKTFIETLSVTFLSPKRIGCDISTSLAKPVQVNYSNEEYDRARYSSRRWRLHDRSARYRH